MAKHQNMIDTKQKQSLYDVVIVGAGMSGSLLALSLLMKKPSLKVLLLDENEPRQAQSTVKNPSFDARCIALSIGSVNLLQQLGLWKEVAPAAQAIEQIQVSDRGHYGALDLTPDIEGEAFGYVVELATVGQVIARALARLSTLTMLYNVSLKNIQQSQTFVVCELSSQQQIMAKLCIGADGSESQVRTLAKIRYQVDDYERSAVICNVACKAHHNIAYERFTHHGPIALLPLKNDLFSVVYCIHNNNVEYINSLSDSDFLVHLQQQFGFRAGVFTAAGARDIYPLTLLTSDYPLAHRVICIGNAAHTLHPVAGQGFNLGLRDVFVLSDIIVNTKVEDIGTYSMLSQYWDNRQNDQQKTIFMTDSLVRIFSNQYSVLSLPRNVGLQAMNLFPFLSQPLVDQAKGQFNLFNRERLS